MNIHNRIVFEKNNERWKVSQNIEIYSLCVCMLNEYFCLLDVCTCEKELCYLIGQKVLGCLEVEHLNQCQHYPSCRVDYVEVYTFLLSLIDMEK
jgi:hypothetical protein